MIKIKLEGPQGSGKTNLINEITLLLRSKGVNYILKEDQHEIEVLNYREFINRDNI